MDQGIPPTLKELNWNAANGEWTEFDPRRGRGSIRATLPRVSPVAIRINPLRGMQVFVDAEVRRLKPLNAIVALGCAERGKWN